MNLNSLKGNYDSGDAIQILSQTHHKFINHKKGLWSLPKGKKSSNDLWGYDTWIQAKTTAQNGITQVLKDTVRTLKKGYLNTFYEKLLSEDHATSSPYLLIWPCTVTSILYQELLTFYQIRIQHLCLFKLEDRVFIVSSSEVQIC